MTGTLLPLAVTLDAGGGACVAGLDLDGRWIRPEPVTAEQVGPEGPYAFFHPVRIGLGPSTEPDARPEDRAVIAPPRPAGPALDPAMRERLLKDTADATVEKAFAGERSAGLVPADVRRVYGRRATGGRSFLRLEFTDASGAEHDWIVRDARLVRAFPAPLEGPLPDLAGPCFLSIGLTKPNGRFPGRFRGCHPLVVGVLSERGDVSAFGAARP
ncbi:hypothetical protein [Streptomyces sp. PSAA01]|uniref:hypothetical protein n=1 Tax=Streptomyces sp. PSAA01 TaxID=2912762 RepID=UPI001F407869|nr:hypothetical protein [Streptomyces sp. PSAA01]MCG0287988.1 hypothetical protein [Streptomyces sp. PSAA01]